MFKGSGVALVTPFNKDGEIDYDAYSKLLEFHLNNQTNAVIVNGTTGENCSLSQLEQNELLKLAVTKLKGKVTVIAGTGSNNLLTTIEKTVKAVEMGADACMVVCPYYVKPTQKGLYKYFEAIAKSVPEASLILYNVPSRTACDLLPETVKNLSEIKNIIGIKEATGDLERLKFLKENCSDDFYLYSGDDETAFDFIKLGGHGVISVTANVIPKQVSEVCNLLLSGKTDEASEIHDKYKKLNKALFIQSNPIPVKWAVNKLGLIQETLRLPLLPLEMQFQQTLLEAMKESALAL